MRLNGLVDLFEMSNLVPADTGLGTTVYVSVKNASHHSRIKVIRYDGTNIDDAKIWTRGDYAGYHVLLMLKKK